YAAASESRTRRNLPWLLFFSLDCHKEMPTLGLPEVLNAAYKLNDWLNFYWNFYVAFTGVVIGWVFSSKGWPTAQKAIVTAFYLGFVGVSIHALWKTYESLN